MRFFAKIILSIFRVASLACLVLLFMEQHNQSLRLHVLQNKLDDAQARWARVAQQSLIQSKQPAFSVELAEVRFDLMSAQQWLLLGRDPETAQRLLDQADRLAMNMPGADWLALRQALAEDEQDLAHAAPVDQVGDELRISALRSEIMALHAPQGPMPVSSSRVEPSERTISPIGWQTAVHDGLQALKQLVQIHPVAKPHELVPDVHDFVVFQQHLNALLDTVGWGVRYGQPKVEASAFQEIFQQLDGYASWLRPQERANLLFDLERVQHQLLNQPAAPPPSLDRSMQVLMRLQHEESRS